MAAHVWIKSSFIPYHQEIRQEWAIIKDPPCSKSLPNFLLILPFTPKMKAYFYRIIEGILSHVTWSDVTSPRWRPEVTSYTFNSHPTKRRLYTTNVVLVNNRKMCLNFVSCLDALSVRKSQYGTLCCPYGYFKSKVECLVSSFPWLIVTNYSCIHNTGKHRFKITYVHMHVRHHGTQILPVDVWIKMDASFS